MPAGSGEVTDFGALDGVQRLVQSIPSPEAEKIKRWLAAAARQQLDEAEDPELAWVRLQKNYWHRGCSNSWGQKRFRGMAARQELGGERVRRGAARSEE